MQKNFILDTNVVLFDPEAIFKLDDNNVIIPDIVLEEVDHFKNEKTERGSNSRRFSRYLDELSGGQDLTQGVSLGEKRGILRIAFAPTNYINSKYDLEKYDNRILYLCKKIKEETKAKIPNILITKDVNLRVKARTIGVDVQDYKNDKAFQDNETGYTGRRSVLAFNSDISDFRNNNWLDPEVLLDSQGEKIFLPFVMNEFVEIYSADSDNKSATLGRFDGEKIVPLMYDKIPLKGTIKPRNIGQHFMQECLLAPPDVAPLVILKGIAGTAKTFFALAAGLHCYTSTKTDLFNRILICRPSVTMDEEVGFLPGGEKEKISPYMRAIKDNVFLIYNGDKIYSSPTEYQEKLLETERLFEEDFIKTEALAFQRGRSLNHYWFILDEMQNSTIRQAKSIVTRGGTGTKIILLGDPDQIDSPYLDSQTNGLSYASEKMKGSKLCWQVTMKDSECERSELAQEAATRM